MYIPYYIKDFYWSIRDFFNPRQKWLTKQIPREWRDKDTILEICVLECLKHYVEKEVGVEWLSNPGRWKKEKDPHGLIKQQKKFEDEVYQQYRLLVCILPELEKDVEKLWQKVPRFKIGEDRKIDYEKVYGPIDQLEKEIYDLKTRIMKWVIENRDKMWT